MNENSNNFINKKILVYGLGKTGLSTFNFLKNKNEVFIFDDFKKNISNPSIRKKFITFKKTISFGFDLIILSPGIDINNCKLSSLLKKNLEIIYTDLDVFYSFYKNTCITVTGTNGKSTTCQLLYEVFKSQKIDVKLVGNIGYPILSSKKISSKTIFIIEASSYQLDYSKIFNSKYAAILNLSSDHIERHKTLKNYIFAKFKLLKSQLKKSTAFINKYDPLIQKNIRSNRYKSKIIQVNTKLKNSFLVDLKNDYFLSNSNQENLSFVLEITKKFKINKNKILNTIRRFKGLKYRQQIIYKSKNLTIVNDSKSTSYSSSIEMLKSSKNINWLLGGIPKKGDKLFLHKKFHKNIDAFIYGKNYKKFSKDLENKVNYKIFKNLKHALDNIFYEIKKKNPKKIKILFSPAAASFDSFNNFEERGHYFNKLIKEHLNEK